MKVFLNIIITIIAIAYISIVISSILNKNTNSNNPDPRILIQHSANGWSTVQEGTNLWIIYIQRLVPPTNNFSPIYNIPSK